MKNADVGKMSDFDKGFYYLVLDAQQSGDVVEYHPKPVFRPDEKHPMVDVIKADKNFVVNLMQHY